MNPADLPVRALAPGIAAALTQEGRLVLRAPTGSGKSTQVPQILLETGVAGDGQIVVLQPRRLPTRMLAARVAAERGVRLGDEVGYQMRFDRVASAATRILFVTEGTLLRRFLSDPQLRGVSVLIFDEFHERHLHTDLCLAWARELARGPRPDLRIIVMSATLDAAPVRDYLAPCAELSSEGRVFPVEIRHLARPVDFEHVPVWEAAADAFAGLAGEPGDVLVFMPGAREIARTISELQSRRETRGCAVLPLHGELTVAAQDAAVGPCDRRKIVVATNVAETSLTIDGVRAVIDCGLARIARFDPHRGIDTLFVERISRASADQRAGRAGRTAPGICVRLWTEQEHGARAPREAPEVRRVDLAEAILHLKALGAGDPLAFPWLEEPDPRRMEGALVLLADLGATDGVNGPLTWIGRRMLEFPAHPRYARMFLEAGERGCVGAVARIAALTQGRPILQRAGGKEIERAREDLLGGEAWSDFAIWSRAWKYAEGRQYDIGACRRLGINAQAARQAGQLHSQFLALAAAKGLPADEAEGDETQIARCILLGFADRVARRLDRGTLRCQLVHGRRGTLARESAVRESTLLVGSEIREVEQAGDPVVLITAATAIRAEWLRELFPGECGERDEAWLDPESKRVLSRRVTYFRDLVLEEKRGGDPEPGAAAEILAREVIAGRCQLERWDDTVEQWMLRVNGVARWCPETEIPVIGEEERLLLVAQVCHGAFSFRELRERPALPVVRSWLSPAQQAFVERMAPERVRLPSGRQAKLRYRADAPPVLSAKIQDLYGQESELRVAGDRISIVFEILAPSHRPVQVTQDLPGFWRDTYPPLKLQLQRKYPRHEWR